MVPGLVLQDYPGNEITSIMVDLQNTYFMKYKRSLHYDALLPKDATIKQNNSRSKRQNQPPQEHNTQIQDTKYFVSDIDYTNVLKKIQNHLRKHHITKTWRYTDKPKTQNIVKKKINMMQSNSEQLDNKKKAKYNNH